MGGGEIISKSFYSSVLLYFFPLEWLHTLRGHDYASAFVFVTLRQVLFVLFHYWVSILKVKLSIKCKS